MYFARAHKPSIKHNIMRLILLILLCISPFQYIFSQWHQQPSGVSSYLRDLEFINSKTGWVCGDGGTILKTTNGGINWVQQSGIPNKALFSIHPVDSNVVYCVGWYETILKTTNGGGNWQIIRNAPVGTGNSYFSVFFYNENLGWIGSTNIGLAKVLKTTNGGKNFTETICDVINKDLYFKDSLNGIGVSEATYISKTSDGGNFWNSFPIAGTGNPFKISILNDNQTGFIVASGPNNIVYKTTNFGSTWDSVGYVPESVSHKFQIQCSEFISDSIGWAGCTDGYLFKTENGGKTWRRQNETKNLYTQDIFALNDTIAWLCGGFGSVYHTINGGDTIVSIKQISSEVPIEFELKQNYPNPFNPKTKIPFSIAGKKSEVKIIVYDALGKLVKELFKGDLNNGFYEVDWDASNLSSGIYFYSLITSNYKETKRMILLK